MNHSELHQRASKEPTKEPMQLALGQEFQVQPCPQEAAAEHWRAVYRLTRELRYRPKKTRALGGSATGNSASRGLKSLVTTSHQQAKGQGTKGQETKGQGTKGQRRSEQQSPQQRTDQETKRQQELLWQLPEVPEVPEVPKLEPYGLAELSRFDKAASNQSLFDQAASLADETQTGRAICRHLIAALRIQHAAEENRPLQS